MIPHLWELNTIPQQEVSVYHNFAIETEGFTRTDTYVIHLAIEVEGGQLKEKAIKMTLETNSGTVYTITRHKGGGKCKIHTMLLYRSN